MTHDDNFKRVSPVAFFFHSPRHLTPHLMSFHFHPLTRRHPSTTTTNRLVLPVTPLAVDFFVMKNSMTTTTNHFRTFPPMHVKQYRHGLLLHHSPRVSVHVYSDFKYSTIETVFTLQRCPFPLNPTTAN